MNSVQTSGGGGGLGSSGGRGNKTGGGLDLWEVRDMLAGEGAYKIIIMLRSHTYRTYLHTQIHELYACTDRYAVKD